jgi:phosphonoacetaldehyde hydrolase
MQAKAVILDWAGTTVDFGSLAPVAAMQRVLQKLGLHAEAAVVRQFMGLPKRDHLEAVLRETAPAELERLDTIYAAFLAEQRDCVAELSGVIPGAAEAAAAMRAAGLKIGSTTGYPRAVMEAVAARARAEGYEPDALVTPDDVPSGRPMPWMCFRNMEQLSVWPPAACIKIGDTPADMKEARNAGMWAVGVVVGGNEIGLSLDAWQALSPELQAEMNAAARARLKAAGAHWVIDSLADWGRILETVNGELREGQSPGFLPG